MPNEIDAMRPADSAAQTDRNDSAMRRQLYRLEMATRAARVGIYERGADGDSVWWSEVMWEIFGQDPCTFSLSPESWLQLIHPEDRARIRKGPGNTTQNLTASSVQYRIIRPDGAVRHVQSIGADANPQNEVMERIGITIDVTERVEGAQRERTLHEQLRESYHQAGMAVIATGVLHNAGNVLNSLGVATATARRDLRGLRLDRLDQAVSLLQSNRTTLATFLTDDEQGRHLPDYLPALAAQISSSARTIQGELETTERLLHHLSDIVSAQQQLASMGGRYELTCLKELVETALLVQASDLAQITLEREFEELPTIVTDRHKLLQILVNLISNARDAVQASTTRQNRILIRLARDGDGHVLVAIEDSGIGMSDEVLSQLWRFGFTTKKGGHGFGLHNSANRAHEIGATLCAHSGGPGTGSRFTIRLPLNHPEPVVAGVAA